MEILTYKNIEMRMMVKRKRLKKGFFFFNKIYKIKFIDIDKCNIERVRLGFIVN